jgi:16S rRNA (adenine1518-N6/adenine1519-N6)-dimethyltransferase
MRKKYGQNFLINPASRRRLLDALDLPPEAAVWEIGPGLGAMTTGLLQRGARVTAFELDPAFARLLRELFAYEKFTLDSLKPHPSFNLIEGDALKIWPAVHAEVLEEDLFLLGNLPYNIAAKLLADFIEKDRFFKRMVVTVQREVALRMAAGPGSNEYSSFSVLCSSAYKVGLLDVIKASSFYPAPRVDSQGVRLDLITGRQDLPELFYPLVRSLFSSRRKIIRNTLSAFAVQVIMKQNNSYGENMGREAAEEVLNRTGISGDRRPETLEKNEFAALAACLEELVLHG